MEEKEMTKNDKERCGQAETAININTDENIAGTANLQDEYCRRVLILKNLELNYRNKRINSSGCMLNLTILKEEMPKKGLN